MRSKSDARRQAIIDVARGVFQEYGFDRSSMSEITARLGGSKATLYNYFPSKEELFVEVMRQSAEALMTEVFHSLDSSDDMLLGLRRFSESFLAAVSQPELISNLRNAIAESGKSTVGRLFYERGPQQGLLLLARQIQKRMQLGQLREADSLVAAQHLMALLRAESADPLLFGVRENILPDELKQMGERALAVFLRAYAPESGKG